MTFLKNIINLSLFALGTAILWSPAIKDVFTSIIIFGIILYIFKNNEIRQIFKKTLTTNKFVIASMCFFCLVLAGLFYGEAPNAHKLILLKKYIRFLFPPLLIAWFLYDKKSKNSLLAGLIFGTSLFAVVSLLLKTNTHTNINPIPISLIFSVICLIVFVKIANSDKLLSKQNILLCPIFLIHLTYLFFINQQKTGIVCFVIVASILSNAMFFIIKTPKKIKIYALALFATTISLFFTSLKKNDRIAYESTHLTSSYTYRIDLIKNGLKFFSEKPIFGHGTGSFKSLYDKSPDATHLSHSHNDYIETLVQYGIVGLFVFFAWFLSPLLYFNDLSLENKYSISILILSYAIAANFDLVLYGTFLSRDFYFFFISSMLANSKNC